MNAGFWRGRRVFLTGHTGFKGGWLALWLQSLGAEVTGYALPPAIEPALFDLARVGDGMHSVIGDIRDADALTHALRSARPEIVLHLAAQPLVRASYQQPVETFATNVMGTVHLLEASRRCDSVRAVLVVTTDKVYRSPEPPRACHEDDRLGGHDPYSASKACAELATACWRSAFADKPRGPAIATARAGNVIGGGDASPDRLVPDTLAAFAADRPVRIRHPAATRPWQHVLEPLAAYLQMAQALIESPARASGAWNFGPASTDVRPVQWIVEYLATRWGDGACWQADAGPHPHEAEHLALDSTKAQARLGWRPRIDLPHALDLTLEWARARAAGQDMRAFTLAQIAQRQTLRPLTGLN